MSHNERDQKRQFFHTCAAFICFETRTITFEIFSLSLEIAITTPSAGKKLFSLPRTIYRNSNICGFLSAMQSSSNIGILFSATSLGATFIE